MLLATKKKTYDARCDLFALGVILLYSAGGYHPFDPMGDASDAILASRIKAGQVAVPRRGLGQDFRRPRTL